MQSSANFLSETNESASNPHALYLIFQKKWTDNDDYVILQLNSLTQTKQIKKNMSQLLKGQPRKMQTSQNDPSVTVGTGKAAVHLAAEEAFVYPAPGKVPSNLRIARQFNSGVSGTGTWTGVWGGSRTRTGQKRLLSIQLRGKVTVPRAPENAAVSMKTLQAFIFFITMILQVLLFPKTNNHQISWLDIISLCINCLSLVAPRL